MSSARCRGRGWRGCLFGQEEAGRLLLAAGSGCIMAGKWWEGLSRTLCVDCFLFAGTDQLMVLMWLLLINQSLLLTCGRGPPDVGCLETASSQLKSPKRRLEKLFIHKPLNLSAVIWKHLEGNAPPAHSTHHGVQLEQLSAC